MRGWAIFAVAMAAGLTVAALAAPEKPGTPVPAATQGGKVAAPAANEIAPGYTLIKMVDVEVQNPQWAQMKLGPEGKFLYVPRYGALFAIDPLTGKTAAWIGGGDGKYGLAFVPEVGRGFCTNSIDGTVTVFDLKTNKELGVVAVGDGAGPIVYDPFSKRIMVMCQRAWTIVPFPADIDLKTGKTELPIKLGVQTANDTTLVADGQGMVYAALNDVGRGGIAVIDTREMQLATVWPTESDLSGMVMDREHGRLFVGCRTGVEVLSAADGHVMTDVPVKGYVVDEEFIDGELFARSSDGAVHIIAQDASGKFMEKETLRKDIEEGQRIAFDPKTRMLYLPTAHQKIALVKKD